MSRPSPSWLAPPAAGHARCRRSARPMPPGWKANAIVRKSHGLQESRFRRCDGPVQASGMIVVRGKRDSNSPALACASRSCETRRVASAEDDTRFYDTTYGRFAEKLYESIRSDALGEDIGQSSWLTADEQRTFCGWLGVDSLTELLEVASGSGGPALFMAETTGCRITGVDIHEAGIAAANEAARKHGLVERARFVCADARRRLPFDDGSFDAAICVDSINHV